MYQFDAYYYGGDVFLSKKHRYSTNEILVQILNYECMDLKSARIRLNELLPKLTLEEEMEYEKAEVYNQSAHEVQALMHQIDSIMQSLPFFHHALSPELLYGDKLFDCLNTISWVWVDREDDGNGYEPPQEDNEYGLYLSDGEGYSFYQTVFIPQLDISLDINEMLLSLEQFNADLKELFDQYLVFIDDMIRVQTVYAAFVDDYLGNKSRYLTNTELAETYLDFMNVYGPNTGNPRYAILTSGSSKMSHEVIADENGKKILCEAYRFNTLGAFLYYDLFRGLGKKHIPKRCHNCEEYFLIKGGKYSDYCEELTDGEGSKTCREIGSRKRYDDKCKNDPVWLVYNRAYKAHYARYMKKKMTTAEFERWSAWAVEIRTQAENKEIQLDDYERRIKA